MPYLPPEFIRDTAFPRAYGADLHNQVRMIREKYTRQTPPSKYYVLLKAPTQVTDNDDISGEPGTTGFDALWGESHPNTDGEWAQPHLSGDRGNEIDAGNVEKFAEAVTIFAAVARQARKNDLKRWGFDRIRELIVTIPLILLDEVGVTVDQGDEIDIPIGASMERFVVKQHSRDGYWKQTNVPLYMIINADHAKDGA